MGTATQKTILSCKGNFISKKPLAKHDEDPKTSISPNFLH